MQNLLEELIQLLAEDERLVSEGKLLKNKSLLFFTCAVEYHFTNG